MGGGGGDMCSLTIVCVWSIFTEGSFVGWGPCGKVFKIIEHIPFLQNESIFSVIPIHEYFFTLYKRL